MWGPSPYKFTFIWHFFFFWLIVSKIPRKKAVISRMDPRRRPPRRRNTLRLDVPNLIGNALRVRLEKEGVVLRGRRLLHLYFLVKFRCDFLTSLVNTRLKEESEKNPEAIPALEIVAQREKDRIIEMAADHIMGQL